MNTKNPIISIITPVYNSENFISETIESVIAQTFESWELILVDDGSLDCGGKICDQYAKKDERIRVFHTKNQGVSKARNYGINQANGTYITFLDSDDLLFPQTIETAYNKIQDFDMVIWGYETFPTRVITTLPEEMKCFSLSDLGKNISTLGYLTNSVCNKLYRCELVMKNHLTFPENISMGEDLLFNLSYFRFCNKIKGIPNVLYQYRQEERDSLSKKFRKEFFAIQRLLKDETDKTFKNEINVLEYTSLEFVTFVLKSIQQCVYYEGMSKKEKIELLKKWLNDEYFISNYKFVQKNKLSIGPFLKIGLQIGNVHLIYIAYRFRKMLSRMLKKTKNMRTLG